MLRSQAVVQLCEISGDPAEDRVLSALGRQKEQLVDHGRQRLQAQVIQGAGKGNQRRREKATKRVNARNGFVNDQQKLVLRQLDISEVFEEGGEI